MGGFFLSKSRLAANAAESFFTSLELPCRTYELDSHHLVLLQKRYVPGHLNFFEAEQGCIAGVGTWLTDRAFGPAALPALLAAVVAGDDTLCDLGGNAAFVTKTEKGLCIFTDRTGHYPVYAGTDDQGRHYASSILALATVLTKLRFNHQAMREFINTEAVLGRDTVFENIESLPPGSCIRVDADGGSRQYYRPEDRSASENQIPDILVEQVARLQHAGLGPGDVCCDLSGGYDSRGVAALLHRAGVEHTLNTNTNPYDPADHDAAVRAALAVHRPIVLYGYGLESGERTSVDYLFPRLDLSRNVPRSRRAMLFFEGKASRHALLLGGYGGELLRDVYSKATDLDDVITRNYSRGLRLDPSAQQAYHDALRDKFRSSLSYLGFDERDRPSERIYFFEKMRAWGGTRTGVYNRYAYGWHPLLDHRVQRYLFSIPIESKAGAYLQKRVIAVDAELARQPYTTAPKQRSGVRRHLRHAPRLVRAYEVGRRLVRGQPGVPAKPKQVDVPTDKKAWSEFEHQTGLHLSQCRGETSRGRFVTLFEAFVRYRDKLEH